MILTDEQIKSFEEASRPLIKWLNGLSNPHCVAVVDVGRSVLTEGVCTFPTEDYWKD